ncbi:hypothetical protein [Actinomadura chokoriensis]|uniref:HEAT repeat domain-containing protein n=1 Tax=Actinomadura chokoriensis TaxID=454156 RepID=A0ABV4QXF2_9ACTN
MADESRRMRLRDPDGIDWAGLERASAADEPLRGLVRQLAEQADRAENPRDGDDMFFSPGSLYEESIPALPFLAGLAESGDGAVRVDALRLLGRLSTEANECPGDCRSPEWMPAFRGIVPRLLAMLSDPDVAVRRALVGVLASAVADAEPVVDALCAGGDDDEAVRIQSVLAVGGLAGRCSAAVLPEALTWLRDRCIEGSPQVAMAASVVLAGLVDAQRADVDVVTRAMSGTDVEAWRHVRDLPRPEHREAPAGTASRLLGWVDERLGDDVAARTALSAALARHRDADRRGAAIRTAANLAAGWRSAGAELLPVMAEHASDEAVKDRLHAMHVIAAMGPDAGDHTEALVAGLDDDRRLSSWTGDRMADVAAWGLAWRGDPRCLPHLIARLGDQGLVYGPGDLGASTRGYSTALPGVADVLAPLGDHAAALLPVIRDRLGDVPETPPAAHVRERPSRAEKGLVRLVGAWGEAGVPAVPELIGLLGGRLGVPAVEALAAMGPAAADAGPIIEEALRRGAYGGDRSDYLRRLAFARAHLKITGDPARLADAVRAQVGARSLPDDLLPYIADLGPHAADHEPWVRDFINSKLERVRFSAAYALGRMTGRPDAASLTLKRELDRLAEGDYHPASWGAVRLLVELGAAPHGRRRELRKIMDADRRHQYSGGWRSFTEDRELRSLAATLHDATAY